MKLEFFIGLRYILAKKSYGFMTVISLISVVGITVGVAALVIVLAVFNGFNSLVTNILVSFDPHVRIERNAADVHFDSLEISESLRAFGGIKGSSAFIQGKVMVMVRNGTTRVVNLYGIEEKSGELGNGVRERVVLGSYSFGGKYNNGIIIGLTLADRLGVVVGDTLTIIALPNVDLSRVHNTQPMIRKMLIAGIYESNNKDYDQYYSFTSLNAAQRLFMRRGEIDGIDIRLMDFNDAEQAKIQIQRTLGSDARVLSWYDLHKELYLVMQIEHWVAYIILTLIIGVASFNLLGFLTMSVIEKTRDIGIMRTIGFTAQHIRRTFMIQGMIIGVAGTMLGLFLGLLLVYLQANFHLFPLDQSIYIIPALPVEVRMEDLAAITFVSLLLSSIASVYPAKRASRLQPAEAVRWE